MSNYNKCVLVGRLTKDAEMRYTADGKAVTKFTIAVNRKFKKEVTDFFNIVTFQKLAEICGQYLNKGSLVLVEGELHNGSYEKDGQKRYYTELIADTMQMMGRKQDNSSNDSVPSETKSDASTDEDIPF